MAVESTQMQQVQLDSILGQDLAPFETLISHLMSSSNEQRSQAESTFNLIKQTDPNSLALKLAQLLSSSHHVEVRAKSASLLPKHLIRDDSYIWPRLSPATQSTIKSVLLTSIQNENSKSIIKKLCATISELASSILPENEWPEIFPFMFQCVTSSDAKLQESAFLIFSQLPQATLVPYIKDLPAVLLQGLNHPASSDVRIAALSAVINFIPCLNSAGDRDRFQDLRPAMMRTLTEALKGPQEATAKEVLALVIKLGDEKTLEEGTRHLAIELAIEFVITLADGMMTKLPNFISRSITRLFAILMKMLLDVKDDPAWNTAEAESQDAGETSNYRAGLKFLDRLSIAFGGNTIVPLALRVFREDLAAPDEWKKHHAALIALAQIANAKGCSEIMIKNLKAVVSMALKSFEDPHPRVRWAAINAIGQLSTNLGSHLQDQYHKRVLAKLGQAVHEFSNHPRVEARAASAVFDFVENCDVISLRLDKTQWQTIALADVVLRKRRHAGLSTDRITGPSGSKLIRYLELYQAGLGSRLYKNN